MSEFGAAILEDLERKILQNYSAPALLKWLRDHYVGSIPMPDVRTVRAYVEYKRATMNATAGSAIRLRKMTERTDEELREMLVRLNIAGTDISDKTALLERLVRFLLVRVEEASHLQANLLDPRVEQVMTNQLTLVKSTTEILLKLEGQIGEHELIARLIVEQFLSDLAPIIKRVAEETYGPDKLKLFMDKLSKEYLKIDWQRIKRDAAITATAHNTGEILDAIQATRAIAS